MTHIAALELPQRMSVGDTMHRVVVTGIGMVAPNGIGRREFSEAILKGVPAWILSRVLIRRV